MSPWESWELYLEGVRREHPEASAATVAALHLVKAASRELVKESLDLPPPMTIFGEGGDLHLIWDSARHHVDVDLLSDGRFEWFYRDRETESLDGAEEKTTPPSPPSELVRRLRLVASS